MYSHGHLHPVACWWLVVQALLVTFEINMGLVLMRINIENETSEHNHTVSEKKPRETEASSCTCAYYIAFFVCI